MVSEYCDMVSNLHTCLLQCLPPTTAIQTQISNAYEITYEQISNYTELLTLGNIHIYTIYLEQCSGYLIFSLTYATVTIVHNYNMKMCQNGYV